MHHEAAGAPGYFGVNLVSATNGKDSARWGANSTANDTVTSKWAGLRTTSTLLHQRNSYDPATDAVVISYRSNAGVGTKAGSYSSIITFTAVANP